MVLKYHSVDEKKITRFKFKTCYHYGSILNIRKTDVYKWYLSAVAGNALIDPDKEKGLFAVRIDPSLISEVSEAYFNMNKKENQ